MARIREYWLQLENHSWDAAPWGANRLTSRSLPRSTSGAFRPVAGEVLIVRRYGEGWAQPADSPVNPWDLTEPNPSESFVTIPGAVLTAKVADEIIVHFRNMDTRSGIPEAGRIHSLQPHGAQVQAVYRGAFPLSEPDPDQGGRRGDRIAPGESFTYRWTCPHRAAAGAWLYFDGSAAGQRHTAAGAFGVLIIQAPGEQEPDSPSGAIRQPGDSWERFAAVPAPPKRGEYILAYHELPGVGLCLNGRIGLGNTPALVAGEGTRMTVRLLNATNHAVTVTIYGHRWEQGNRYNNVELLPPGSGSTLAILSGSAEGGGGLGEWLITGRTDNHLVSASFVTTRGGRVALQSA